VCWPGAEESRGQGRRGEETGMGEEGQGRGGEGREFVIAL